MSVGTRDIIVVAVVVVVNVTERGHVPRNVFVARARRSKLINFARRN